LVAVHVPWETPRVRTDSGSGDRLSKRYSLVKFLMKNVWCLIFCDVVVLKRCVQLQVWALSGGALGWQVQGPKFKLQYHQKRKKKCL
jgi:hypothetical protein